MKLLSFSFALLRPRVVQSLAVFPVLVGLYDALCNQFGLPKIPRLWGMTGSLFPSWNWLVWVQLLLIIALFEYVRRAELKIPAHNIYDDTALTARVAELENIKRAIIDDYQRICGMEAHYDELYGKLNMHLKSLINLPEKLESIRVDSAITSHDVGKLSAAVKDHRERAQTSFHALEVREKLPLIQAEIMQDVADLVERLRAGETYDRIKWNQWQNIHAHWREKLDEWLELGTWYALAVKERVNIVDERKYEIPLVIAETNFPDAEAVRRFKKFLIIQGQWQDIIPEVQAGVDQVAFTGLTEREVRHGRPAG